jgi:hypothetical protein
MLHIRFVSTAGAPFLTTQNFFFRANAAEQIRGSFDR